SEMCIRDRRAMTPPLPTATAAAAAPAPAPAERSLADTLDLDEIHVEFAPDLVGMILGAASGLDLRIANMRRHVAATWGLILPEIRLTDDRSLGPGEYRIRILGSEQARDRLMPGHVLALLQDREGPLPAGTDVREPVYGAPARWLPADSQEEAALAGLTVIAPTDVLATHLLETIRRNFPRLLSLRALRRLLAELGAVSDPARAEANRRLVDELVPDKVPVELLLAVLRLLLEERVSIRNLPLILEAVAEGRALAVPEAVCEHVRRRLGFQLVAEIRRPDGTIPLIQLAPEWEETFLAHQSGEDRALPEVALPPDRIARLAQGVGERLAAALEKGLQPAVVTTGRRRRLVRTILAARSVAAPVLSVEEIGLEARPAIVGVVPA
ncbi:MAG: FHIPEP family type III secretion protein, partial [Rhodobacteraceae bacterium]|nr:FHIPEP family type III secretion protein [Paracoccaceae bacterium]